jgi:hypothetical protein
MPIDPAAFTNAFNAERDRGFRERAYSDQQAQLAKQNARQDTADTQNATLFQQSQDDRAQAQKAASLARIGSIAQKALTITDPTQRKGFLQQSIGAYQNDFAALGSDTSKVGDMLALPDDQLAATLGQVAQFAPKAKPIEVAKGGAVIQEGADGKYSETYRNPDAADEAKGDFSLNPGEIRFDRSGKKLAEGGPKVLTKPEGFDIAAKLRGEYNKEASTFTGVADAYQRIKDSAADPSAAGDLALIFNYMKVLDPGSTVREGEFATAEAAGSIPSQIVAKYNKVLKGERLAPEQRADFVGRADRLYKGQENRFNTRVKDRYTGLAKRYGLDPAEVLSNPTTPSGTAAGQSVPTTNAQGWTLHVDAQGNQAYVSPDGKQFQEVR